ncbi:MAG: hypothetical protein ACJARY_000373 [Candidatus Azotimanducaceae bacterium]|jgi:hypothetical protein
MHGHIQFERKTQISDPKIYRFRTIAKQNVPYLVKLLTAWQTITRAGLIDLDLKDNDQPSPQVDARLSYLLNASISYQLSS